MARKGYLLGLRFNMTTWVYIAGAWGLGFVIPRFNERYFPWLVSPIEKATILTILSSIASGMITLTGIVFSLVFVIVQFGSSAYSPRIIRLFANVRVLRHSLGIFTGTFLYSLIAMRTVGVDSAESVGLFTVWVAVVWLLGSIVVLAKLVSVFTTLTVGNVLFALGKAGRECIARLYLPYSGKDSPGRPVGGGSDGIRPHEAQAVVYEGQPKYVLGYDLESLAAAARAADAVIHLPYAIGDGLQDGEPVAVIRGAQLIKEKAIYGSIALARERGFQNDPRYALRLLVDMAIRALSPAINDPTTAVQALDHIEMLLHRLGNAELDIGNVRDRDGRVRVVYRAPVWEDFVQLGLIEIMQYGESSVQVQRRLEALFLCLRRSVPAGRVPALERIEEQRLAIVAGALGQTELHECASVPDRTGIGEGEDNGRPWSSGRG